MGFRVFAPQVAACPGCGRTTSTVFQELAQEIESFLAEAMPQRKTRYPGVETLNVAAMGCIVNRPARASTPTSASPRQARARRPPRRCSSTGSRP